MGERNTHVPLSAPKYFSAAAFVATIKKGMYVLCYGKGSRPLWSTLLLWYERPAKQAKCAIMV